MSRIIAITAPDARSGFACCGAVQHVVSSGEVLEVLTRVLSEPGKGVVLLDERLVTEVGEERLRFLEQRWPGVVVILPAPEAGAEAEDYAARLIRRAVGYHVRVRK